MIFYWLFFFVRRHFRGYGWGLKCLIALYVLEEPPDFLFNTIIISFIFIFRFFIAHIWRVPATVRPRSALSTTVTVSIWRWPERCTVIDDQWGVAAGALQAATVGAWQNLTEIARVTVAAFSRPSDDDAWMNLAARGCTHIEQQLVSDLSFFPFGESQNITLVFQVVRSKGTSLILNSSFSATENPRLFDQRFILDLDDVKKWNILDISCPLIVSSLWSNILLGDTACTESVLLALFLNHSLMLLVSFYIHF